MMEAPDFVASAPQLDFPPCHSLELVLISEHLMFGFFPALPQFIRAITSAERAAGFGDGFEAVLVTKASGRIERTYGNSILLN